METDLHQLLHGYGNREMINDTVVRWVKSGANWDIFYGDYPFGQGIPPMNVKHILENHERLRQERLIQERQERLQEARSVASVMEHARTHRDPTLNMRQIDPNLSRYIAEYLLKYGDVPPPPAAGGKRKSRRNRKYTKSRKSNRRKSNRRKSNRRR
jgi:hypothetical protein